MNANPDKMVIEILEDGTLKVTTDKISTPNHLGAENFLKEMGRLCGGLVKRVRRIAANRTIDISAHTHDGHTHTH